MAKKTSPFAALTSEQKQIKWMEYQSIRLPYTEAVSPPPGEEQYPAHETLPPQPTSTSGTTPDHQPTVLPPREVYVQSNPATAAVLSGQQKTRHHQYDAVIARMKQAELLAGRYYHCSEHSGSQCGKTAD